MDRAVQDRDSQQRQFDAFPSPADVTPATLALHNNFVAAVTALKRDMLRSVHFLRVIQDRRVHRALGYAEITAYARAAVGFSPEQTRAFLALGRRLERFPETKRALAEGQVSWSKARLIVTKIDPEEERIWLDAARGLATGRLRKALADAAQRPGTADGESTPKPGGTAEAGGCAGPIQAVPVPAATPPSDLMQRRPAPGVKAASLPAPTDTERRPEPAGAPRTAHRKLVVSYALTPEQYARWEILTAGRKSAGKEEHLLAGLEAANVQGIGSNAGAGPAYLLTISRCPQCQANGLVTSRGRFPVGPALLEAARCDAIVQAEDGTRRASIPPRLRRRVLARDGHRCQSPGCTHTRHLQIHHRVPVAQGGETNPANLVTLCSGCHRDLHRREDELRAASRDPCR